MMKFVRAFCSMESKRVFLRSLGCLDDLLFLEEESGHFLNAVELARCLGYVQKEAEFLEKAGHCGEAAVLLLWFVFFSSLWGNGGRGWPLKHFSKKEDHCEKARSLAKMSSDHFYDFVCNELEVLSDQHSSLPELKKVLLTSQKHKSLRGEILSVRKILDFHFRINFSKYFWEDELPSDITEHCENKIFQSCVSVRTLVFYWNQWKENVMSIFQSIECLVNEEPNKHEGLADFSISYFGVRKQCVNGNRVYLLVNKDGDWISTAGNNGLHSEGKLLYMNLKQLAFAIRSYWQSELLSVGMIVLLKLEGLYKSKSNGSPFHQSTSLVHIFEVSKFLSECQCLNLTSPDKKKLQSFLGISAQYFDLVFPLDWRRSVSEDMVSLRETDLSLQLLNEIILQSFNTNSDITDWTIGRVMMICVTYGKQLGSDHIVVKGKSLPALRSFVMKILRYVLKDTLNGGWRLPGYISIHSVVYFLDIIIFHTFISSGIFFTTRSSLVGWLSQFPSTATPYTHLSASNHVHEDIANFAVSLYTLLICLFRDNITTSWMQNTGINSTYYHPILALKLMIITILFDLQAVDWDVPADILLGSESIAHLLPSKFVYCLLKNRKNRYLNLTPDVVAEAFRSIEDPLVIVCSKEKDPRIDASCALFVDLRQSKEEIMNKLFANYVSESSNTTEAHQLRNHLKEIGDGLSEGGGNTHDVKNKKGKGKRTGKKAQYHKNVEKFIQKLSGPEDSQGLKKLLGKYYARPLRLKKL